MKYRKKPVVIEAFRYGYDKLPIWFDKTMICGTKVFIDTLEGRMVGNYGDYIIKGVNGEIYPCQSDSFEKIYEVADEEPKIKIESDGNTATIYIDGEKVKGKMVDLHFHGDVDDGIHIVWDYEIVKENKKGMPPVENDKIVTEKHHFDNRESY